MSTWLLLDVDLRFEDGIPAKTPRHYRPDMLAEGSSVYYGIHFVIAPEKIDFRDQVSARVLMRPYPDDPCLPFQPDVKVLIKEGNKTVAQGLVRNRMEYSSQAVGVVQVLEELRNLHQ
jgi:hypothetical protein